MNQDVVGYTNCVDKQIITGLTNYLYPGNLAERNEALRGKRENSRKQVGSVFLILNLKISPLCLDLGYFC